MWDEVFFMGSWWLSVAVKFRKRFFFSYYERFISLLWHNKFSIDFRVCDCFFSLDFGGNLFTFWGHFFRELCIYDYIFDERPLVYNVGFNQSFSYFENTYDNFDLFDYIADILFFTKFFLASFFKYAYFKGLITVSFKLYIFWRLCNFAHVRSFFSFHKGLVSYFKCIQLDVFFFKRLRTTLLFVGYRFYLMRYFFGYFSIIGKADFRRRLMFFFI